MSLFSRITPETQKLIDENEDMLNECLFSWIKSEKLARSGISRQVLDYFTQAKKNVSPFYKKIKNDAPKRVLAIQRLVKIGYHFDDFKVVIDHMIERWHGTKMQEHLTPETLFSTQNFPKYHESAISQQVLKVNDPNQVVGTISAMTDD